MVQKSKILGKFNVVFLTTGTTKFPFERLLKSVDYVLQKYHKNFFLIAQIGNCNYNFHYPNTLVFKYIPPNILTYFITKSDAIITHASYGILFQIEKLTKICPLILCRRYAYKEHIDDHQFYFAKYLKHNIFPRNKRLFVVTSKDIIRVLKFYLASNSLKKKRNFKIFKYTVDINNNLLEKIKKIIDD